MIDPASPVHRPAATEYFFAEGCHITEWWNSPADTDVSVARARVEPGVTTRWHRLRAVTERYLILEGRGRVEVGDGPPEDVGPGDVVLVPPETRQRITNLGEADLIFLAVCTPRFTPGVYEDLEPFDGAARCALGDVAARAPPFSGDPTGIERGQFLWRSPNVRP